MPLFATPRVTKPTRGTNNRGYCGGLGVAGDVRGLDDGGPVDHEPGAALFNLEKWL